MSKLIQFRLDDQSYNMLCSCLTQERIKANEQIEKYGSVVNPFRNMSENQFAQQVLINTIAKRYIELHQGTAAEKREM